MGKVVPLQERFWAKVDKSGDCWLWTASKIVGYGQIRHNNKTCLAHRLSYEWARGPIPEGLFIDHTCHVRHCVNPEHLRPVTNKQNMENHKGANRNNTSGVRGVLWNKQRSKWMARVGHNGCTHYVGLFDTVEAAGYAVKMKRLELFTHNDLDRSTP